MIVTAARLRELGACSEQVALFEAEWPEGLSVPTDEAAIAAVAARVAELRLDVGWAARHLLSATALRAYDEARAPAERAYDEATATALRAYQEATATALLRLLAAQEDT